MFGIFHERLLNKAWKLNQENIDNEEKVMKDIIAFFYDWRTEVLLNNANHGVGTLIREKYCIAKNIPEFSILSFWIYWLCKMYAIR